MQDRPLICAVGGVAVWFGDPEAIGTNGCFRCGVKGRRTWKGHLDRARMPKSPKGKGLLFLLHDCNTVMEGDVRVEYGPGGEAYRDAVVAWLREHTPYRVR